MSEKPNKSKMRKILWITLAIFIFFYVIGLIGDWTTKGSQKQQRKEEISFYQRGNDEIIGLPYEIDDIEGTKKYSHFLPLIDDQVNPFAGGIYFLPYIIEDPINEKEKAKIIFYVDWKDRIKEDPSKEVTFTIDMIKHSFNLDYDKDEFSTMVDASHREIAELLVKLGEGERVFISIGKYNGGLVEDQKVALKKIGEAWLKNFEL